MQSNADITERFLDQRVVESIAAHLATGAELTGGFDRLAERRDLQPAAEGILGGLFADRLAPNRKVVIPTWERVGHVDLTVLETPGATTEAGLIELKWSGGRFGEQHQGGWTTGNRPVRPRRSSHISELLHRAREAGSER